METWKKLVGFEGAYEVSDFGRIRSTDRMVRTGHGFRAVKGRILKPFSGRRYSTVTLSKNSSTKTVQVHRAVLAAFVGPKPESLVSRHLDGNSRNNALSNLEYSTQSENMRDKLKHGTHNRGEAHASAKLTNEEASAIRQRAKSGTRQVALAREYGVSEALISLVISGQRYANI